MASEKPTDAEVWAHFMVRTWAPVDIVAHPNAPADEAWLAAQRADAMLAEYRKRFTGEGEGEGEDVVHGDETTCGGWPAVRLTSNLDEITWGS